MKYFSIIICVLVTCLLASYFYYTDSSSAANHAVANSAPEHIQRKAQPVLVYIRPLANIEGEGVADPNWLGITLGRLQYMQTKLYELSVEIQLDNKQLTDARYQKIHKQIAEFWKQVSAFEKEWMTQRHVAEFQHRYSLAVATGWIAAQDDVAAVWVQRPVYIADNVDIITIDCDSPFPSSLELSSRVSASITRARNNGIRTVDGEIGIALINYPEALESTQVYQKWQSEIDALAAKLNGDTAEDNSPESLQANATAYVACLGKLDPR